MLRMVESQNVVTEGSHRRMPGRVIAWLGFVLIVTGIGYAGRFADGETPEDVAYRYSSSLAAIIQYAIFLGVVLLIARGLPIGETLALRRPASWPRSLGLAAAGLLAIWLAAGILAPFLNATEEQGLLPDKWDSSRASAFAAFFVAVAVVAPFAEELVFRGLGFALLAPYGKWVAILVTGVLFGTYHGLLEALPVLIVFGVVISWLRDRTDSLYPGVALHATFNGTALVVSVAVA